MNRRDVMTRDWHHDYYPNEYLPDQPVEVIAAHFAKMVGTPLECGPVTSQVQVDALQDRVSAFNAEQARRAAGTTAYERPAQKLVLWRGCWAILARTRPNNRPGRDPLPFEVPAVRWPARPLYDFAAFLTHRSN